jgi:hypothetical protein
MEETRVTRKELHQIVAAHNEQLFRRIQSMFIEGVRIMTDAMAAVQQAETDLATAISAAGARVSADLEALQTEISTLQANGTDTSALQAIAASMEQSAAAVNAIDPAPVVAAAAPPSDGSASAPAAAAAPDSGAPATTDTTPGAASTDPSAPASGTTSS